MKNKMPIVELPWGTQPSIRIRKNSLATNILRGIALTGMVLVAVSNPYFGVHALKIFKKEYKKAQWRKFQRSLHYLKSRGYVNIISQSIDGMKVELTRAGHRVVKYIDIATLELPKPKTWDQKWRVIVFDVPNWKSKNRAAFREKIKELGFKLVQKSVWIYPHESREVIMILRKFYDIEKYVTYLETIHSEDEDAWQRIFHMENKMPSEG